MQVLAFDADGVVICPPQRFFARISHELCLPPESGREFFGGVFQDCLAGRADLREVITPLLSRWGWLGSVDDFLQRWFEEEHCLNEPILDMIQTLRGRGHRCVIATNQERYRLAYMKNQMGFGGLFDKVFGSADVGAVKPAIDFFDEVTRRLRVRPSDIIFWDDTLQNVRRARTYGWNAECFSGMEEFRRTLELHTGCDWE